MATVTQFLGTGWTKGKTIPVSFQLSSGGSFSNVGSITINSITEFSINFSISVSISIASLEWNINETVEIDLPDQNPSETSGPFTLYLNGNSVPTGGYTEDSANNPSDLPGGTAAYLNGINISDTELKIVQIWSVGTQTAIYIDPKWSPSFWLLA